jgi:hypothetical protein
MAPAGLWTTPSDLARMAIEVQNEFAGKSSKILSQSLARQMLSHQIGDWGLGFGLEPNGHTPRFGHGGSNEGYRCDLEAYTGSSQGVAIMTNSDSGAEVLGEILHSVAKEYGWPDFQPTEHVVVKLNPALFEPYVGAYEVPGVGKLVVTLKSNALYIQADPLGPEPQQLFPDSEKSFFILTGDVTFSFERSASPDSATQLTIHAGPQTLVAKKIS